MDGTNDCKAYIDKLEFFGTNFSPGKLIIGASAGVYGNTNFVVDNVRHGPGYGTPPPAEDYSIYGSTVSNAITGIQESGVPGLQITYRDGIETNGASVLPPHITSATNVAGYISWGAHSTLGRDYALGTNKLQWSGASRWYIVETIESYNGVRINNSPVSPTYLASFLDWFSPNAFGGSNYLSTPVGAVTHVDEPGLPKVNDSYKYFNLWALSKNFAICAWNSRNTDKFQAVGDPLITR